MKKESELSFGDLPRKELLKFDVFGLLYYIFRHPGEPIV